MGRRWQWVGRQLVVARVAQLVEHTLGKGEVIGSIPIASSGGSCLVSYAFAVPDGLDRGQATGVAGDAAWPFGPRS